MFDDKNPLDPNSTSDNNQPLDTSGFSAGAEPQTPADPNAVDLSGETTGSQGISPEAPAGYTESSQTPPGEELAEDIHTMPEKFMSASKPSKKKLIIGIAIAVIALAIMVLAGLYFFSDVFSSTAVTNTPANANKVNLSNAFIDINQSGNKNSLLNGNVNASASLNANANVNINSNSNTNGSLNLNLNVNQGLNSNVNQGLGTPLQASKDTDADGLTDLEEELYKTNKTKADSDGDGYFDGAEVLASFDPNDQKPVKLLTSGLIKEYNNQDQGYKFTYPAVWVIRSVNPSRSELLVTAATGEYVQILVQTNAQNLSALDYYRQTSGDSALSHAKQINVGSEAGILSNDLATVYVSKNSRIYILTYQAGAKTEVNYRTTFKVIYQGLQFTAPQTALDSNQNSNANASLNKNSNTNVNSNQNSNTNTNRNANQNSNVNRTNTNS